MKLTRLFELIEDDAFITVYWDGQPDFEHQGRKDDYLLSDNLVVVSISESKEEGIIIVVGVRE